MNINVPRPPSTLPTVGYLVKVMPLDELGMVYTRAVRNRRNARRLIGRWIRRRGVLAGAAFPIVTDGHGYRPAREEDYRR